MGLARMSGRRFDARGWGGGGRAGGEGGHGFAGLSLVEEELDEEVDEVAG